MNLMTKNNNQFEAEERFYSELFYLSYSGLNKLLYSPRVFYKQYVMGVKEEKLNVHLVEGKVVHCLILEEGQFHNQFMIIPSKVPEGNPKIIMDSIWAKAKNEKIEALELGHFQEEILEMMVKLNYYQALKTDVQRIDKILSEENIAYYQFLQKQTTKTLISSETYEKCLEMTDEVTSDESAIKSLYHGNVDTNVDIHSEHYLTTKLEQYAFYLKGFLDRLVIDRSKRLIRVCDFKTTAKPIDKFKETIEFFRYNNQAAIYTELVQKFNQDLHPDDQWKIEFHFTVIDLFKQVYVFEVSPATMIHWNALLHNDLEKFNWHYVNKKYNLPYELAKEKVIL